MGGATLKLKRLAMGTPVQVLARRLRMEPRAIQRWESGQWEIPPEAAAEFDAQWDDWLARLGEILDGLDTQIEHADGQLPDGVDLIIYRTLGDAQSALGESLDWGEHTQLMALLTALLGLDGIDVSGHWYE